VKRQALFVVACCALPWVAAAQDLAPAAPAASAPYVDRVMDGAAADADRDTAALQRNNSGRPRWWRVESRWGRETASIGQPLDTLGVALQGGYDTLNHGAWSIDAQTRRVTRRDPLQPPLIDAIDTVFTVRQRGFPLGGGWWMNNDFGAIGMVGAALSRVPARVALPLVRVQGASGEWLQPSAGWSAALSAGRPAVIDSFFTSELSLQPGRITQAALQWSVPSAHASPGRLRSATQIAAQVARGQELQGAASDARIDAHSLWVGGRHQAGWGAAQLQVVTSSTERRDSNGPALASVAPTGTSHGVWLDIDWRSGAAGHSAGGYKLGAGLNWAGLPMAADADGLYWRAQWQNWQWSADGGIDLLRSGSSSGTGVYGTFNLRQRLRRDWSWGLNTAVRRLASVAYNVTAQLQWSNHLGQTIGRIELDGDRGQTSATAQQGQRLSLNHDWALANGWTVSTGATMGQASGNPSAATQNADRRLLALATSIDASITPQLTLRGSGNAEHFGSQLRAGVQAALDWQLSPEWNLETRMNVDRGRLQRFRSLDPLAPPLIAPGTELNARSLFVVLRYQSSAGSVSAPLGGRAADGGGSISGIVYRDENRNGRQDAGEPGAAGVTVQLDGRYTAVTDGLGRFEFAWVAAGSRMVTVLNETLPLPWVAPDEGRTVVEVALRKQSTVTVAVVQQ
jgi:SdrD B-like domain